LELIIPNLDDRFEVESDASNVGLGGVLRQNSRPVAYISRCLTKCEKNYTITEREVLAALWSMEKFKYYLEGRRFTLITDHKALEELKFKRVFGNKRIGRWFERIEQFQFDVKYRKGEDMLASDVLSRHQEKTVEDSEDKNTINSNSIQIKGMKDDQIVKIIKIHEKLDHRKCIQNELRAAGIKIKKNDLERIFNECLVCKKKEKNTGKTC
jgi:hypothetical protein